VSAKIRLLPTQEGTISLVRQIATTGISCLTVHCRTQEMRPREPALLNRLREIVDTVKEYGIPVVANGDCWGTKDKQSICELTGEADHCMRKSLFSNPSISRRNEHYDSSGSRSQSLLFLTYFRALRPDRRNTSSLYKSSLSDWEPFQQFEILHKLHRLICQYKAARSRSQSEANKTQARHESSQDLPGHVQGARRGL